MVFAKKEVTTVGISDATTVLQYKDLFELVNAISNGSSLHFIDGAWQSRKQNNFDEEGSRKQRVDYSSGHTSRPLTCTEVVI